MASRSSWFGEGDMAKVGVCLVALERVSDTGFDTTSIDIGTGSEGALSLSLILISNARISVRAKQGLANYRRLVVIKHRSQAIVRQQTYNLALYNVCSIMSGFREIGVGRTQDSRPCVILLLMAFWVQNGP